MQTNTLHFIEQTNSACQAISDKLKMEEFKEGEGLFSVRIVFFYHEDLEIHEERKKET